MGSSPLTRGKQIEGQHDLSARGLIPAHAGKTDVASADRPGGRAHPRSRGENYGTTGVPFCAMGSSPLTRGKLTVGSTLTVASGLIPAHAGKTLPDLRFYRADRSDLGKP